MSIIQKEECIKLSCIDGTAFMPESIVQVNKVLKDMIDDCLDIDMTPVNFPLQDIINYIRLCELRKNPAIVTSDPLNNDISDVERNYFQSLEDGIAIEWRKLDPIGRIISISDFLDNEGVTDVCAKYIVIHISKYSGGKEDIETLRKILQVENDLTEEEEAKIRKANAWCCTNTKETSVYDMIGDSDED
jgi:hypothetical protein